MEVLYDRWRAARIYTIRPCELGRGRDDKGRFHRATSCRYAEQLNFLFLKVAAGPNVAVLPAGTAVSLLFIMNNPHMFP